jgi:hypothetical protein
MTLDGAVGPDLSGRGGGYVLLYGASDDTGRTFTVVGIKHGGVVFESEAITGPDSTLIVLGATKWDYVHSVTPDAATAGAIEIGVNGYVDFAAAGAAQHVAIYSAGDDSSATIAALGLDRYSDVLTETITGVSANTSTSQKLNFSRIDRLTLSTGSAGAVEAGYDGLAESQWFILNYRGENFNVGIGVDVVTGTLTYAVQHTWHNLQSNTYTPGDETVFTHDTLTGKTADDDGNYTNPPRACRLAFTAFTSGSAIMHIAQSGSGS